MTSLAAVTFTAPHIAYDKLYPLLIVFAVALAGVLVEAFVARDRRYVVQATLSLLGLLAALVGVVLVARGAASDSGGSAHGSVEAMGAIAIDGPSLFIWGTLLVFSIISVLLFAERKLEGGVTAFAGQASAMPGTEAEREASTLGVEHTEVFPLMMFAVGGMMLFPAANDLVTMFVALEVLSLPLYLLCGLARRRRLISQEAAMKYFLLGALLVGVLPVRHRARLRVRRELAAVRHRRRGVLPGRRQRAAARRHGTAGRGAAVQGRCRPVPLVDARCLPGRADAGDGVHGRVHEDGRVRCAAQGVLRRARRRALGLAADDVDHRGPHDGRRVGHRHHPDRRQADAGLLLVAHAGFLVTGFVGAHQAIEVAGKEITSLQAVLFYLVAYGVTTIGAFAIVTIVRDAGGETTHLSRWAGLGKEAPVVAGVFAFFLLAFAGIPLTSGFTGQVGGLHGRLGRRGVATGGAGRADERGRRVLLRPSHRVDVLLRAGR